MKIDRWLDELKIPRKAYRLVMLMPLVYVAWADGRVQPAERKLIMGVARDHGLLEHGGEETLERWLTVAPSEAQLKKDLRILNELCHRGGRRGEEFGADSEILLLAWCQDVADAAGGFLGLRSARDPAETDALKKISSALEITNSKKWATLFG